MSCSSDTGFAPGQSQTYVRISGRTKGFPAAEAAASASFTAVMLLLTELAVEAAVRPYLSSQGDYVRHARPKDEEQTHCRQREERPRSALAAGHHSDLAPKPRQLRRRVHRVLVIAKLSFRPQLLRGAQGLGEE